MSIPPIGGVGAFSVQPTGYLTETVQAPASAGFESSLTGAVDNVQAMQATSSDLAVKAVTGDLADVHDYTIASTQAAVALELTAAVRNRAVEAFTEIMRMQA